MSRPSYNDLSRPVLTIEKGEIAGYVDPWIASPGDEVDVKVRLLIHSPAQHV